MKSAIIKRLPAAGFLYLLLSLLYFGTVGDYSHMYLVMASTRFSLFGA